MLSFFFFFLQMVFIWILQLIVSRVGWVCIVQGFTQYFSTTVFHSRLSFKCSWGSVGCCKLWVKYHSNLLKPLEMVLFVGYDKLYSYCIVTSNFCCHILLNSWENLLQSSLLFTKLHWCALALQHYAIFDYFQNEIVVTKLYMKSSLTSICCKNVHHEARLVSIFPGNFESHEINSSSGLAGLWGQVCSGDKLKVLYLLCLTLGLKWIKQGKK